uniref:Uncharacterized protein n=1 Tax=Solanum demissum TaxID=50514 RepID=Q0KIN4_SOLDE|nr:hypothetical protein SDM1_28t00015 [Solanum demissum]
MEKLYKGDLMEFYKREIGFSKPRNFSRRISASESLTKFVVKDHLNSTDVLLYNNNMHSIISQEMVARILEFVVGCGVVAVILELIQNGLCKRCTMIVSEVHPLSDSYGLAEGVSVYGWN